MRSTPPFLRIVPNLDRHRRLHSSVKLSEFQSNQLGGVLAHCGFAPKNPIEILYPCIANRFFETLLDALWFRPAVALKDES